MKKAISLFGLTILLIMLTGCASIVSGTQQSISIETPPTKDATCSLVNDKGKWFISHTPGSVTVHRSYQDLMIDCEKQGYKNAHTRIKSLTKPMAFGNAIFGGLIGAGVDVATGSAYDYPTTIQVPMVPYHSRD